MHISPLTLEEYIDNCRGIVKKSKKPDTWKPEPVFRRTVEYIPSHGVQGVADTSKKVEDYKQKNIIIKGCSDGSVPDWVYVRLMEVLQPHANRIAYGEACSSVPLYKL